MLDLQRQPYLGHFKTPERFFGNLDPDVAGSLIAASADVALVMDDAGVIRDLAFGNEELLTHGYQSWIGKSWAEIVTVESRPKVEDLLREANSGNKPRWRHINHSSADGADLPLSYSVISVARNNLSDGERHTVAIGRDLRSNFALQQRLVSAQLSMERDYWRLRHVETRYRLLFQLASEAVLIFDARSGKLEEANPAAYKVLGEEPRRTGWMLADSLDTAGALDYQTMVEEVRANGRAGSLRSRLKSDGHELVISASLFRQDSSSHLMVRISSIESQNSEPVSNGKQLLLNVMERAPDAFVVTDLEGRILSTNRAFLDLVQLTTEDLARNESLEKWLGRAGVDMNVLISNLRQGGTVRLFATTMRGELGSNSEVEISGVSVTVEPQPCLGFTIRDVGRRLTTDQRNTRELPRSPIQMTELVGRVPLRDIVRETTDLIEQLCIEAALELTKDNRASAAEMLGLSRQSLYVKLRRFGIGDAEAENQVQ
jgi:transcriptional regulator PpsR